MMQRIIKMIQLITLLFIAVAKVQKAKQITLFII